MLVVEAVVEAVFDLLVNVALLMVVLRFNMVPVAALKLPPRPIVPMIAVPAGTVVVGTRVALETDAMREETDALSDAMEDERMAGVIWDAKELEEEEEDEEEEVVATAALPPVRVNSPV